MPETEISEMDSIFNTFSADNLYQSSSELFDIEKEANEINYSYDPDADAPVNVVDPNYSAKEGKKKDKKGVSMKGPDFEPNLGKVIDTLNTDYPVLFYKPLDYSIYIEDIEVTDPTGIAF